jgi:hypothetical protein
MAKLYDDYVKRLADQFDANLTQISVGYNFDYGDEYEIAICKTLRSVLPDKYGICRGYLVAADGRIAGDDIIIYDKFHLPLLRPLDGEQYAQKQKVPVESVYAYIEAKHGLVLEGNGQGSISKAFEQVGRVKELLNTRQAVALRTINRFIHLPTTPATPEGYPDRRNPSYAMIFARHVKQRANDAPIDDATEILEGLKSIDLDVKSDAAPDLIVLGKSCLIHPVGGTEDKPVCRSPFYGSTGNRYLTQKPVDRSFGVALLFLMAALEYMEVGRMNWGELVVDAFKPE